MKFSALVFATILSTTQSFLPATMPRASITRLSVVTDPTETTVNNTAAKKAAAPATTSAPQQIEVDTEEAYFLNVEGSASNGPLQP